MSNFYDDDIAAEELHHAEHAVNLQLERASEPAKKYDAGKPPLDLLPFDALCEVAKVLAFGAKKYGKNNWKAGMSWSRLLGAALRHLFAWAQGEDKDPETGLSHLAHCCCCCLFALSSQLRKVGTDDR